MDTKLLLQIEYTIFSYFYSESLKKNGALGDFRAMTHDKLLRTLNYVNVYTGPNKPKTLTRHTKMQNKSIGINFMLK